MMAQITIGVMARIITNILLLCCFSAIAQKPLFFSHNQMSAALPGHRMLLTVDHTKCGSSNQTDFTLKVYGTNANLKSIANGGYVQNSAGSDNIYFSTDIGGSSKLSFAKIDWVASTGYGEWDVKIPTLTYASDYTFYIQFGDPAITTFQGGSTGAAYDSYTKLDYTGEVLTDQSANGYTLTQYGTGTVAGQSGGQIGNCFSLVNSAGNFLAFTSIPLSTTNYTITGWCYVGAQDNTSVFFGRGSTTEDINWYNKKFRLYSGSGDEITAATDVPFHTWTHFVLTQDETSQTIYFNGASDATSTNGNTNRVFDQIGRQVVNNSADIKFDEIRIDFVTRSPDWALVQYNQGHASIVTFGSLL